MGKEPKIISEKKISKFKVKDLQKELKKRGLKTGGRKAELQKRLREYQKEKQSEEKPSRKRPASSKDDRPKKRAKKEEKDDRSYLSDDEPVEKMDVEKTEEEVKPAEVEAESPEKSKVQEEPKEKAKSPKKENSPEKPKEVPEKAKVQSKSPVKAEPTKKEKSKPTPAPVVAYDDFSGAEDDLDFSGAEEEEESSSSSDEHDNAPYRSGSLSPPPPAILKERLNRKLRTRFAPVRNPRPILPQAPSNEQLQQLNLAAIQSNIESQLNALTKGANKFMKEEAFKEVLEPVLEREKLDIDPSLYDPRIGVGSRRSRRSGKALKFFKPGTLVQKANRITQLLERQYIHATPSAAAAAELDGDDNYLSDHEIPEVEWWDTQYLREEGYETNRDRMKVELITSYIHNPMVLTDDLNKTESLAQLPLYLTRKEKDKIRRKKSKDKHDQMIDEIRLGIREAPEPKLKLSNIVRVLGSQFIQDPSAAEAKARTQISLRQTKHLLHNENRKLTKTQRSEKKRKKLLEDKAKQINVAIFRVKDLSDSKVRWKIKTNAKQFNLSGCMMLFKGMNMVMVEGGPRGIARYTSLMTRRIKWNQIGNDKEMCVQVWAGVTGKHVFREFVIETFEDEADVIKYLDQKKVLGYWKQCKEYQSHTTY